ncbi:Eco57I restriction-modification methylase domain-containing protein [Lysinibacillus sp. VIII_CA]|uniref:Eco57I restriction-modification methylase domain-containing protein n=1 Tax=Lysinibacillus sp. VIII_CA TaxID=3417452 RepID=UPI003CF78464
MTGQTLLDKLKEKTLSSIFQSSEYIDLLKELTSNIIEVSKEAENEATIVSGFEIQLYGFVNSTLGLRLFPEKEKKVDTERHITKGRIDSKVGAIVKEFKHTSKLETQKQQDDASEQLIGYLRGLEEESKSNYYGIITDGVKIKFIRLENGQVTEEPFQQISHRHMDRIIKSVVLMKQKALTPENLVEDFYSSEQDSIALDLVHNLYKSLNSPSKMTTQLFEEWKELFRLAHDDKSKQQAIEDRRKALSDLIGHKVTENSDEYKIIYSLQTSYAIIIKLLAFNVLSKIRFNTNMLDLNSLATAQSEALRSKISEIEDGGIFKDLGMLNVFEGDFFSWYCSDEQWNEEIAENIRVIFALLSKYEDKSLFTTGNSVQDLFKDLYMKLIPEKVRHSLGEFYTPSWLSDNVVDESLDMINHREGWKGLDPCAGSGTFIITMIRKIIEETAHLTKEQQLHEVLSRVKGIDLNPLAVLTARINYFINISHLIEDVSEFEIPIYLGDASYVPEEVEVEGVSCLKYVISTVSGNIDILLPLELIHGAKPFSEVMSDLEEFITDLDIEGAHQLILAEISNENLPEVINQSILNLCTKLVALENEGWNGIWTRIVKNFLTTALLGKFDIIVGNPPWIDWKNLPEGYRERIKSLCISRHLFSGDGRTGGINLNICALISNVVSQRWLKSDGMLAFLMPQTLVFQQSYEGFRKFQLDNGSNMYFQKFTDWTKSGHPFKPVTEKFLTYFINGTEVDYSKGVPASMYKLKKGKSLAKYRNHEEFSDVVQIFDKYDFFMGQTSTDSTKFSYAEDNENLVAFAKIAGECPYKGREGIEFYPQELFLLEIDTDIEGPKTPEIMYLTNYQNKRSKHKVPKQTIPLEKKLLHPLVKGTNITRFHINKPSYIVPFPYKEESPKVPMDFSELRKESKLLATYFRRNRTVLENQTDYSNKLIGDENAPYYALARVGKYSFAKHHVVFRDNTKWVAAVSSPIDTEWGENRRPLFQNHAVSICEKPNGDFITEDEAHYICAILNAPIVQQYILNSSDSRSFKIRPPVKMVEFDEQNEIHLKLSNLSKEAHMSYDDKKRMLEIDALLDELYLQSLGNL